MKTVATGLLVLAALIFVVMRVIEEDQPWAGYVRATAEAAMVGALADWFAVTAIFKHPLRIPIPHTAIVRRQKDRIGQALGEFVTENFLTDAVIVQQLEGRNLAERAGAWLSQQDNAEATSVRLSEAMHRVATELSDDSIQSSLESIVVGRIRQIPVAKWAGRGIDLAIEENHHQALVDSTLTGLGSFLNDNKATFRLKLAEESPWWVPEPIDDRIFDKIYDAVNRFISEVGGNRHHELRHQLDARTVQLAERLKSAPELQARGEELKDQLLSHPEFRSWVGSLWSKIKDGLEESTGDPSSELRLRLDEAVANLGRRLAADPEFQAQVDEKISETLLFVARNFQDEVVEFIASAVRSWEADDVEERVELQVGKDLQFIRINGTLIGGFAGLVIHTASELFL